MKRTSCSRTKFDFLRAIHSFLYLNQISSFSLPGTAFVGDQENSSSWSPVLHFWGLGLCVVHQDSDALHENASGGCSWKPLWFPTLLALHEHSQLMDKHRRKVGDWTKLCLSLASSSLPGLLKLTLPLFLVHRPGKRELVVLIHSIILFPFFTKSISVPDFWK